MSTIENSIECQNQFFGLISRATENLKKLGAAKTTRGRIQSRIDTLKSYWDKFQANHEVLLKSTPVEAKKLPYFKDDLFSMCEEEFLESHGSMLDLIGSFDTPTNPNISETSMNSSTGSRSRRLPRIDVPTFSGDYAQWSNFRDLFVSLITENTDISAVEKLHYLKMSLSGEPSQHLRNIAITSENFSRAWETLVARYENKRMLINAQLATLFSTRKIKNECAAEIKRLHGDVKEALDALETLGCPIQHWDLLLVYMMVRNLDPETRKRWEETLGAKSDPPSFSDFETFLVNRLYTLESLEDSTQRKHHQASLSSPRPSTGVKSHTAAAKESKCALCASGHYIASCPKYMEKQYTQRREIVTSKNLCFNCLGSHHLKAYRNAKRCRICSKRHHSTLRPPSGNPEVTATANSKAPSSTAQPSTSHTSVLQDGNSTTPHNSVQLSGLPPSNHIAQSRIVRRSPVLLATVVVTIFSRHGEPCHVRALFDQGSEVSFVSESVAQRLKLPRRAAALPILGIGAQRNSVSNGIVSLTIASRTNSTTIFELEALVLPKLTAYIPPAQLEHSQWPHLQGLHHADPDYASPGKIELILGANVYARILEEGLRRGKPNAPIAQRTALGWVLSGPLSHADSNNSSSQHYAVTGLQCSLDFELLDLLQRFWTQEEIVPRSQATFTPEEAQCEDHFNNTYSRDSQGQFVVRLPQKRNVSDFGDSRTAALKSLLRLEKRFESNQSLKSVYLKFLLEYRDLDHMRLVDPPDCTHRREFFLPHHGVVRETSSTTKLRVVFNGSQKTSLGFSLNDVFHVGPKLQKNLTDIIIRWRRHQYVFAADIEKMYRQIRVHKDDWPLQKILWRPSPNERTQEFQLCTVTYGLACAPYLALRCLNQLALEAEASHALAADVLRHDTYVDDVLSGAADLSQAKEKIRQLNETLKTGGFHLRKWIANDLDLLTAISPQDRDQSSILQVDESATHHTLGILWERHSDRFIFSIPSLPRSSIITKRSVLSFIARMFDPLGWLAPIVVIAKMFMQELWAIRLDWDEELPDELNSRWTTFTKQLEKTTTISIPRWFGTTPAIAVEIHGFSDASQHALAAVVYVRVLNEIDEARITLVCAKTKVAPLKRVTIPRLELSAAVLLVRQVFGLRKVLELPQAPIHLWTDSTVALTWIKNHPSRWPEFVQNRVSFIQELSNSRWHHVPGKENPADLASRGVPPHHLQQEQLWWTGPSWLQNHSAAWPSWTPPLASTTNLEDRPTTCTIAVEKADPEIWDLIENYSSLTSLLRVTAWLLRSRNCFRNHPSRSHRSILDPAELNTALLFWISLTQRAYFIKEIQILQKNKQLLSSSSLLRLAPILDTDGLLRLRGRLQFSLLKPAEKHPLILPRNSRLTTLVIDYHHQRTLHGGPQLTLSSIRQKFWIIGGRVPIRSFIHRCVTCARHRASASQHIIGQLPSSRVAPCRPFLHTGVDYAGPLSLKTFRGRGFKTYTGYFIIFVCFSTSAIHLEVATDYSTAGFIAAYKRFSGRRGICSTLTSDCGTNLIGADAELKKMFNASSQEWTHVANALTNDGVQWKFNPSSAPHFGGKWEAGVKSVKRHLRRVIGDTLLTYEEMTTLLIQIEAILNSRPLSPLSDDPTDVSALTPGHFLVGSALTTVPEPSLEAIPETRLSRWQLLRQMTASFWQRWSTEYLHQLQTSPKWHRKQELLRKGALVLIKDERFPPLSGP